MMNFNFQLKAELTDDEFLEYFSIMKNHLISLYGEKEITEENYLVWKENRNKNKGKKLYVKMYDGQKICGYADFLKREDDSLYFCDIVIDELHRKSFLLLEFLKHMFTCQNLKEFQEIYFHINKRNLQSLKTFSHLNYEKIEEGKNSDMYKITREKTNEYLRKFAKIKSNKSTRKDIVQI